MESSLLAAFASHGLAGLVIFALGAWVVYLHRELANERRARLEDIKGTFSTITGMQDGNRTLGDKLADVMADIKQHDREQRERDKEQRDEQRRIADEQRRTGRTGRV